MSRLYPAFLMLLLIAAGIPALYSTAADTCCPPTDPSSGIITYEELVYFQGDDPKTAEVEIRDNVHMIDKMLWVLPWNATRIYVPVPEMAKNVTIDNVEPHQYLTGTTFLPGRYSWAENPDNPPTWDRDAEYPDFYYWQFPPGVDRNYTHTTLVDSTADFEIFDAALTNASHWLASSGNLSLKPGIASSNHTGNLIVYGRSIASINITWTALEEENNITVYYSVDNGSTWSPIQNGNAVNIASGLNEFRWRIQMQQDTAINNTPVLGNISARVTFLPEVLELWFKATFEMELEEEIAFETHFSYNQPGSTLIFLGYFDPDVALEMTGMEITKGEQGDFPGKDVYRHMMGPHESYIDIRIFRSQTQAGGGGVPLLFGIGMLLVLAGLAGLGYMRYGPKKWRTGTAVDEGEVKEGDAEMHQETEESGEEGDSEMQQKPGSKQLVSADAIKELEALKDKVLQAIKRVDQELEDGLISKDDHEHIRAGYKKRAVEILKEMDGLKDK